MPAAAHNQEERVSFGNEEQHVKITSRSGAEATALMPPCHLLNGDAIHCFIRFGLPVYLLGTFGLLLASDLGSGVSADLRYTGNDGEVLLYEPILVVSIFSSVFELWKAGSYPLAIFIVITSICWPYIKLALTLFAWVVPFRRGPRSLRRRERLIEWLDALGKWSFVDIKVFIIVMVAFRMTIPSVVGYIDVFIVPKWGFFGFVFASMLSLAGTHATLHFHRKVMYGEVRVGNISGEGDAENLDGGNKVQPQENDYQEIRLVEKTGRSGLVVALLLLCTFVFMITGALLDCFTYTYTKVGELVEEKSFSLVSIGANIPESSLEPNTFGMRFIQAFYFILVLATPLHNIVLFAFLYFWPMAARIQKRLLFLTEVTFAWGAIEVYFISAIFSIQQIPKFGTGIVSSGCSECYVVGARLLPEFSVLGIGAIMNFGLTLWLIWGGHGALYKHSGPKGCWC